MAIDTKTAPGRRKLHFDSYDALIADAESLAAGEVTMVGNWSLGQIFQHLAVAYNGAIDGLPFSAPWYVKLVARAFMKKKFLYGEVPSGFQIPDKHRDHFVAADTTTTVEGLANLRAAVERLKSDPNRVPHPVLGKLTTEQWDSFNLRHAELHLSFAVPK